MPNIYASPTLGNLPVRGSLSGVGKGREKIHHPELAEKEGVVLGL